MISIPLIIYTSVFLAISSTIQGIAGQAEDLKDEYYTIILKPNNNYLQQDDKDAQTIVDNNRKEETIAGILSHRDKIRRFAIQQRMLTKMDASSSWSSGKQSHTRHYWVSENYPPQRDYNSTYTFMDLCFGLLLDENVVLGQYLENFFSAKDETWVTIDHKVKSFTDQRQNQREPYENMLKIWVRQNREVLEAAEPNKDAVKKDADALKAEYESGHWHEKCRDQLELILMKKSIKYARAVLAEFQIAMKGKKLEDIINENVNCGCNINRDLADAYSSLARYIKDKHTYIADILHLSNGSDHWAAWVMCIAVVHPQEWPKVDQAFQKKYKVGSLSKFIMDKLTTDKVMAEMIAKIVDPTFKPSTFAR